MKKRPYRAVKVKQVEKKDIETMVAGHAVVIGIDVAKTDMVAAVVTESAQALVTVKWSHPEETSDFLAFLNGLREVSESVVVGMEPTGTYGDALRYQLLSQGYDVQRVSPLRVKHSCELFDGVASSHDGKAAAIISKLVKDGTSEAWPMMSEDQRRLKAVAKAYDLYQKQYQSGLGQLEAELARYWPEISAIIDLDRSSLWQLLIEVGGPEKIARARDKSFAVLRKAGGYFLKTERIEAILESAEKTCGVPMHPAELAWLQQLANHLLTSHLACNKAKRELEQACAWAPSVAAMASTVGKATAAMLVAELGDPTRYKSAAAYEKAYGLNLRERSSGKHRGQLRITKRGPGKARKFLFLSAMRLMRDDPTISAWVDAKPEHGAGWKIKRLVGLMRKLARALWHMVTNQEHFDITRFIDVKRLELTA